MSGKYSFALKSLDRKRRLPGKIIIGRNSTETLTHVLLKFLGYLLFHRDRIHIETNLHLDSIPYVPDLVQLDFELRPVLWVECGDCGAAKLNKLAVKVPDAEIWILKRSPEEAAALMRAMERMELRRNRYRLAGLDPEMIDEVIALFRSRNDVLWVNGGFDPPGMQFDFNGIWFDSAFTVFEF